MVEKVIKDGKVAVLVSPGFGAGWSTWADSDQSETLMFHPTFIKAAQDGVSNIEETARDILGDEYFYCGGWRNIEIQWIDQGSQFTIREYDGSESLMFINDLSFTE